MDFLLAVTVARVVSDVALAFAAFFAGFCGAVIYIRFISSRQIAPVIAGGDVLGSEK